MMLSKFLILSVLIANTAQADFHSTMKSMGKNAKVLEAQAKSGHFDTKASLAAKELLQLIRDAQIQPPDNDVVDPNDTAKLAEIRELIRQEELLNLELIAALERNEEAQSVDLIKKMAELRKEAHNKFKP